MMDHNTLMPGKQLTSLLCNTPIQFMLLLAGGLNSCAVFTYMRYSIAIIYWKLMLCPSIITSNNTSQAYGLRKQNMLKPGGYFFMGAA